MIEKIQKLKRCRSITANIYINEYLPPTKSLTIQTNMRYLIATKGFSPFLSKWFEPENHFNQELEMIVYDLVECKFTTDGIVWQEIPIDTL